MITQSELKDLLHYDQNTGIFTWLKPKKRIKPGAEAGCFDGKGYRQININQTRYFTHRLAWLYVYGEWPNIIDHINGNPLDNRICNLRSVTLKENSRNSKTPITNTSGVKGVNWHKSRQKWRAVLNVDGKSKHLGYFDNIQEAEIFIKQERIKYHGEFTNHGERLKNECLHSTQKV